MDILLDVPIKRILKLLAIPSATTAQAETDPGVKVLAALLYVVTVTADGRPRDFKWHRLPPASTLTRHVSDLQFMGWGSRWSYSDVQPRVHAALLERIKLLDGDERDTTPIGKVFRRLPDLESELADYSALDHSTQEAWVNACRDTLLAQSADTASTVHIHPEPVVGSESDWWPRVVEVATRPKGPRRKRCPHCRKRGQYSGLFTAEEMSTHVAVMHASPSEGTAKTEPPAKRSKITK